MEQKTKIIMALTMILSLTLVGCSGGDKAKEQQFKDKIEQEQAKGYQETMNFLKDKKYANRISYKEFGFQFYLNDVFVDYKEKGLIYMLDIDYPSDFPMNFVTSEELEKSKKQGGGISNLQQYERNLFLIKVIDKKDDTTKSNINELEKKYSNKKKLGEAGNFEYYIFYNDNFDTSNLSEKGKKEVNDMIGILQFVKGTIEIFEPVNQEVELENLKKLEFKAKTIDGKPIDSSIFKDYKITMINIWMATKSTEVELSEIQKFYEENKGKGVNVLGIVLNGDEEKEKAQSIISWNGVKFTNIVLEKKDLDKIDKTLVHVPMKIFVDNDGNILGHAVVGNKYKEELENRMKLIK